MTTATLFSALIVAVVDEIIPRDRDPGALDLGTCDFVLAILETDAASMRASIAAGLSGLNERSIGNCGVLFHELDHEVRKTLLEECEDSQWFRTLAELVAEGFYADPENGGNRDARSWQMIGYEHRLPDGPSGRPRAHRQLR